METVEQFDILQKLKNREADVGEDCDYGPGVCGISDSVDRYFTFTYINIKPQTALGNDFKITTQIVSSEKFYEVIGGPTTGQIILYLILAVAGFMGIAFGIIYCNNKSFESKNIDYRILYVMHGINYN